MLRSIDQSFEMNASSLDLNSIRSLGGIERDVDQAFAANLHASLEDRIAAAGTGNNVRSHDQVPIRPIELLPPDEASDENSDEDVEADEEIANINAHEINEN